ncbi:Uma2 family endonuclease [Streptomyces boncukensis]|uniref:Uma2 family endonuclease n=1 Tax=Streptomyces boncukensis TaxID=2711219 RepID=A0A6G4X7F7_9ACTN|nr:Uma2 family endonuclease [Streptomyces boncukensis]NGO72601.1 Uma2 family endonuclease [Streptomyces boncukensis]
MTALAHEMPPPDCDDDAEAPALPDLDQVLWQAWQAMELPEGYRAEIIEGAIEVSPTGRRTHAQAINRLRNALVRFLGAGTHASFQDTNMVHGRKVWIPDLIIAPEDLEPHEDEDGLGIQASAVALVAEVVSPGRRAQQRDRERRRREYARAGIPVYVIIDDHDGGGSVTVLSGPLPEKADYSDVHRVPYGTEVTIPEGPAKGFAINEDITGPQREG